MEKRPKKKHESIKNCLTNQLANSNILQSSIEWPYLDVNYSNEYIVWMCVEYIYFFTH